MLDRIKNRSRAVKRDIFALYLARRDPRVPWYAKALALATIAYALSPIDLVPDFIPVLGYLDDLLIVPVAIFLSVRLMPQPVMAELREKASLRLSQRLPGNRAGTVFIVALWAVLAALAAWALFTPKPTPS